MGRNARQILLLSCLALAISTAPAHAQTGYPPTVSCLEITPSAGPAGTTVTVIGHARAPGTTVTVALDVPTIGLAVADSSGSFTTTITIPTTAQAGVHNITVTGAPPGCQTNVSFRVLAADRGLGGVTSGNLSGVSEVAAGAAVLTTIFVFATRRRREMNRSDAR